MWLLVDDTRTQLGAEVIARSVASAKVIIQSIKFNGIIFDHDLGETETGYDVLMWAGNNGYLPDKVQICTSNPVGRDKMSQALQHDFGFTTKDNYSFERVTRLTSSN